MTDSTSTPKTELTPLQQLIDKTLLCNSNLAPASLVPIAMITVVEAHTEALVRLLVKKGLITQGELREEFNIHLAESVAELDEKIAENPSTLEELEERLKAKKALLQLGGLF